MAQSDACQKTIMPQPPSSSRGRLTIRMDLSVVDAHILQRLEKLDLTGRVQSREEFAVGLGAFSDVFKGVCMMDDRGPVTTAMKRLRILPRDTVTNINVSLHRVCNAYHHLNEVNIAFRERDLCMVKAQTSKCSSASGICFRRGHGLPDVNIAMDGTWQCVFIRSRQRSPH